MVEDKEAVLRELALEGPLTGEFYLGLELGRLAWKDPTTGGR